MAFCLGILFVNQAKAGIETYYEDLAPIHLAYLKGCDHPDLYDKYLKALISGMNVTPSFDKSKMTQYMDHLQAKMEKEYYLLNYYHYDQYEAEGHVGQNIYHWAKDDCVDQTHRALEGWVRINQITLEILQAPKKQTSNNRNK